MSDARPGSYRDFVERRPATTPDAKLDALMAAIDRLATEGVRFALFKRLDEPVEEGLAVRAAAVDYGRAVAIAELEAAAEGGGCCLCGAVDPDWVCLAHQRLTELRAEEVG